MLKVYLFMTDFWWRHDCTILGVFCSADIWIKVRTSAAVFSVRTKGRIKVNFYSKVYLIFYSHNFNYRISANSFRPWIVSSLEYFPHLYVLLPKVTVHKVKFKKEQFPRKLYEKIWYLYESLLVDEISELYKNLCWKIKR